MVIGSTGIEGPPRRALAAKISLAKPHQVVSAASRHVKDAGGAGAGRQRPGDGDDAGADIGRMGRAAVLVVDDAELRPFSGKAQHRAEEVRAMRRVDPRRAQDRVPRIGGGDRLLAGKFGCAVDRQRRGRVGLDIGRGLGAIEDVVGGNLDDGNAEPGRCFGDRPGPDRIDGEGEVPFALGLVDGGIGGGVDHDVRLCRGDRGGDRFRPFQVQLGTADRDDVHCPVSGRKLRERPDDLPLPAGGKEPEYHHAAPRRSPE